MDQFLNRTDILAVSTPNGPHPLYTAGHDLADILDAHLTGEDRIGTYTPTPGTSLTKWLCIDIDAGDHHSEQVDDPQAIAKQLMEVLDPFGYLEVSGSGKGYHVWVFFDEMVPAGRARALAKEVLAELWEHRAIQVYPRQDYLPEDGTGNMVWLPWWGDKCQVWDVEHQELAPDTTFETFPSSLLPAAAAPVASVQRGSNKDTTRVRRMLEFCDGRELAYDDRIRILQAIHSEFGDDGYDLAKEWTETWREDSTSRSRFDMHWNSFSDGGGVTLGTLAFYAIQGGYREIPVRETEETGNIEHLIEDSSDLCLAEFLIDDLEQHGPLIWAFQNVWQFDGRSYHIVPDELLDNRILDLHGRWPESAKKSDKPKPLNISAGKQKSVRTVMDIRIGRKTFDGLSTGVSFRNGLLTSDGLIDHTPDHFITHHVDCDFDPDATHAPWTDFLQRTFDGDEDPEGCARFLRQFVGACLMGDASHYSRAVLMYGDGGTGKSTFIEAVEAMFPQESLIHIHPQAFRDQYARAELASAKLDTMKDLPDIGFTQTGYFKDAVEGARISARRPYGQMMYLEPRCGFLFASNALPYTDDVTGGFWRRWGLLACRNVIPEREQNRSFRKDLVEGARTQSWLYAWAWRGYQDLLADGVYTLPASHYTLQDEWRQMSDATYQWFHMEAVADLGESVEIAEAYGRYKSWAMRHGHKPTPKTKFLHSLLGYGVKKKGRNRVAMSLR